MGDVRSEPGDRDYLHKSGSKISASGESGDGLRWIIAGLCFQLLKAPGKVQCHLSYKVSVKLGSFLYLSYLFSANLEFGRNIAIDRLPKSPRGNDAPCHRLNIGTMLMRCSYIEDISSTVD